LAIVTVETTRDHSENPAINTKPAWLAIGKQFCNYPEVLTLGVRPSFGDYEPWERELLLSGRKIYFPTRRFIDVFRCHDIPTYPNWRYYRYIGHKFRQTHLFQATGIPHPRTKFYWGKTRRAAITTDFSFPFVAKIGKGSSQGKGVYFIRDQADLDAYCEANRQAYIQEYIPVKRSARVILLNGHIINSYWIEARDGSFWTNVHQGGDISDEPVPEKILRLARVVAAKCGFDEVGLDIIQNDDREYVLEANMVFGTKGLEKAGINLREVRYEMLLKGLL